MPTKPFWKSGTIWGLSLLALPNLVQFVCNIFGVDVSSDTVKLLGAQIAKTAQDATPFVTDCVQLAGFTMGIIGRFNAHKSQITVTAAKPLIGPGVTKALVILAALPLIALMTGCAGSLPAGFTSPPLSATNLKFAQDLSNLDTPAALTTTETTVATGTSIAMYVGIKQSSTMETDGLVLFGGGTALEDFSTLTLPGASPVTDIFQGLKTSAASQQSAINYDTIAQVANGPLAAAFSWIQSGVNSTTDPDVKAYALKVFCDQVHAVGKGICDATVQYSGNATLPTVAFTLVPPSNLYAANP